MIVCGKCGGHNEDDADFCESCGEYLAFEGKRIEESPRSEAALAEGATGELALGPDQEGVQEDAIASAEPDREERAGSSTRVALEVEDSAEAAQPFQGALDSAPATTGADEQAPDEGDGLRARLPGEEYRRRARPRQAVVQERPRAGDVFCTSCGTGNTAAAKFCKRCGASLLHAEVARVPWWRRLFPRRRPLAAGERPGRRRSRDGTTGGRARRGVGLARKAVLVLAVVAAAIAVLGPWRSTVVERPYEWARGLFADPVEIHPPRASGAALRGHPARHAIDTTPGTFWAPPGAPRRKAIVVHLNEPTDLRKVGFRLGSGEDFTRFARPRVVRLRFLGSRGRIVEQRVQRLRDTSELQVYDVDADGVSRVRLAILRVYPGQQRREAAIAKVALWKRG